MSEKKLLPPFVKGLKDQLSIINSIVDMFESECDHPHCVAMRAFFEQFPGAQELKPLGKERAGKGRG